MMRIFFFSVIACVSLTLTISRTMYPQQYPQRISKNLFFFHDLDIKRNVWTEPIGSAIFSKVKKQKIILTQTWNLNYSTILNTIQYGWNDTKKLFVAYFFIWKQTTKKNVIVKKGFSVFFVVYINSLLLYENQDWRL